MCKASFYKHYLGTEHYLIAVFIFTCKITP